MSGFATNLAAINSARKQFGKEWRDQALIEKLDGQWYVQVKQPVQAAPAPIIAEDKTDEVAAAQADRIADQLQTNEQLPNGKVWVHKSSILKPTKQVWHIADEMVAAALAANRPAPTRKEVQDECVRRGIASGTARTQYQAWKKANDDAAANSAAAAAASARFNSK